MSTLSLPNLTAIRLLPTNPYIGLGAAAVIAGLAGVLWRFSRNKGNRPSPLTTVVASVLASSLISGATGFWAGSLPSKQLEIPLKSNTEIPPKSNNLSNEESAVVSAVDKISPAVVSIIITKDIPKIERYYTNPIPNNDFFNFFRIPQYKQNGTEKKEVGGGTGFIISQDGYIVTNKHVVTDEGAEYTVLMNDESRHKAKVLARDPVNDLAILKIDGQSLPAAELGESADLKVGQIVIAIGNALGEFRNTVSVGVISGLSRSITAGGAGVSSERLTNVIQTDASINPGNSGGPLLNLDGRIIGINTAIVQGAQNIGFAIPIDEVKSTIQNVREHGRIVRPWLGIRYVLLNQTIAESNKLKVDYGALIIRGEGMTDLAVIPGSPADKAGLEENDIILEINGQKIDQDHSLAKEINSFQPGDTVTLKVLHKGKEENIKITLEEMN